MNENFSPEALKAAQKVMEKEKRAKERRKLREEQQRQANEKREEIHARVRPRDMNDKVWNLIVERARDCSGGWEQYEYELEDLVEFISRDTLFRHLSRDEFWRIMNQ